MLLSGKFEILSGNCQRNVREFCFRLIVATLKVSIYNSNYSRILSVYSASVFEPHHLKTGFSPMRKQSTDQSLCFCYTDSTSPLLLKSKIASFYLSSVAAKVGLCLMWLETAKTGFLASRLICDAM